MMKHICRLMALMLAILSVFTCASAEEKPLDKTKYNKVLAFIKENQPMEFDMEQTKFSIKQLKKLMAEMPEDSTFNFTIWYCNSWIDNQSEVLDLDNGKAKVTKDDLKWLIDHMPNVKEVYTFNHRELDNKVIVPMMEEYPEIKFNWLVTISSKYRIRTDATAFSTQKKVSDKPDLTEKHFENLKYVPGLKALDIGHNAVKDLSWLKYLPELEVLILADNSIKDITPIAQLEHLEYLELFMNNISDVTPLAELKNLRDLNLCRTKLKETDLSVLDGLELERFWCTQANVSKEQQARYIEANPETNANFTIGSCTDNGWRDSYKYKQFRTMFKNRTWTDFVRPEEN
ncbi:MAG: leucine-rich repeat domain-containing protein [Clostridia bacterium]|nr:leucine-rich repeat domain-containing protein [Clostridia bacterium]